jgi:hypothetical protein
MQFEVADWVSFGSLHLFAAFAMTKWPMKARREEDSLLAAHEEKEEKKRSGAACEALTAGGQLGARPARPATHSLAGSLRRLQRGLPRLWAGGIRRHICL